MGQEPGNGASVPDHDLSGHEKRVRHSTVRAGVGGVAATAAVITMCSPAGLGGIIGDALAYGVEPNNANSAAFDVDPHQMLLSGEEFTQVQVRLDHAMAALDAAQEATDAEIARLRSIAAQDDGAIPFANAPATRQT